MSELRELTLKFFASGLVEVASSYSLSPSERRLLLDAADLVLSLADRPLPSGRQGKAKGRWWMCSRCGEVYPERPKGPYCPVCGREARWASIRVGED